MRPWGNARAWHLPLQPGASLLRTLCGGHGFARQDALGVPKEATSRSLHAAPLCRCGSAHWPQLCLALDQLQVLSSRKGDAAKEEEGSKHTNSLVLVLPCSSCIVTFLVSLGATSHSGDGQHLCPAPQGFILFLWLSPWGKAVQACASAQRLGNSRDSDCFSSLSAADGW